MSFIFGEYEKIFVFLSFVLDSGVHFG